MPSLSITPLRKVMRASLPSLSRNRRMRLAASLACCWRISSTFCAFLASSPVFSQLNLGATEVCEDGEGGAAPEWAWAGLETPGDDFLPNERDMNSTCDRHAMTAMG